VLGFGPVAVYPCAEAPALAVGQGGGGGDAAGSAAVAAEAPRLADGAALGSGMEFSVAGLFVKVVLVLGFICGLIYGIFWLIAKKGRARSGRYGLMRLVETLPLGQNRHIGIVEVAQRYFVVGIGDHSINPIAELDASDVAGLAAKDEAVPAPDFLAFFNDKVRRLKRGR